ncbi:MAG: hypothetical protein ACI9OJ_000576 [Myxococcota bacterium]|jgi:hypothetical protein
MTSQASRVISFLRLILIVGLVVLLFFSFGITIALWLRAPDGALRTLPTSGRFAWSLLTLYCVLVAGRASLSLVVSDEAMKGFATQGLRLVGVAALWQVACSLVNGESRVVRLTIRWSTVASFLHCSHWPTVDLAKIPVGLMVRGDSDAALLLNYLLSVSVTIGLCLFAAFVLDRIAPGVYARLNGGRTLNRPDHVKPPVSNQNDVPSRPPAG